jgi:hypothetical protein
LRGVHRIAQLIEHSVRLQCAVDAQPVVEGVIECRELAADHDDIKVLAEICERFAIGDDIHIIPAGLYIEE